MAKIRLDLSSDLEDELREMFRQSAREVFSELSKQEIHTKPYLNLSESADYIGCSFNTLKKFIRQYGLKVSRVGTYKLISKDEIVRFLKQYES